MFFLISEGYNALTMPTSGLNSAILFYDDQCGLCQKSVRFFLFLDRKKKMNYAPLFGETYEQLIPNKYNQYDSVLFYENGYISIKSNAIIRGVASLGGVYRIILLALIFPRIFRDFIYDQVAKKRKQLTCDLNFNTKYKSDKFLK